MTFGGDVNKTKVDASAPESERNVCTAASGDVCQAGLTGTGDGQFGIWEVGSFITVDRSGPEDEIFVGDQGRIQVFDTDGNTPARSRCLASRCRG